MGNTPSRSEPTNRSSGSNNGGGGGGGNDGGNVKGGGVFRLPVYRGGRDAFLPMDGRADGGDDDDDVTAAGDDGAGRGSLPPPRPPHPGEKGEMSPPSVASTSCDSSYATQLSPASGGGNNVDVGGGGGGGGYYGGESSRCQAGGAYSTHRDYVAAMYRHGDDRGSAADGSILPYHPLSETGPKPRANAGAPNYEGGIFDCVKPHSTMMRKMGAAPPSAPSPSLSPSPSPSPSPIPPTPVTPNMNNSISYASSPSLTSLFGACIRSSDEAADDNEYTNEDLNSCSDHGSYQGRRSTNYPHIRQGSVGSTSSQASQRSSVYSHNSYHKNFDHNNNTHGSKSSLLSVFSSSSLNTSSHQQQRPSSSHASSFQFTEEERNMPDGDDPTHESDLGKVRTYHVVTTAALPWMTGTAVNPLLRAAHLLRRNGELLRRQEELERERPEGGGGEVEKQECGSGGVDGVYDESIELASPTEVISATLDDGGGAIKLPFLKKRNGKMQHQQCRHVGRDRSGDSDMATADSDMATAVGSSVVSSPTTDNIDQSPGSLDYSACSPSEVGATPTKHPTAATSVFDNNGRGDDFTPPGKDEGMGKEDSFYSCFSEAISPLGDSLLLSPFDACTPRGETTTTLQSQHNDHVTNEKLGQVTLIIPWLADARDRSKLYGPAAVIARDPNDERTLVSEEEEEENRNTATAPMFATQEEQEVYIRSWLANDAGMPEEANGLNILFYPARFHKFYNSIFALGDICDLITDESADVCILEEPEHLNWYRAPGCSTWSSKFVHCVGVIHTNYKAYAREHAPAGFLAAPLLAGVNSMVVQANCHRVVKLSGVLQEFAPMGECIENVHGIRETYLKEGERRRQMMSTTMTTPVRIRRRAYFIGKLLWAKGFDQLLELETSYRERSGDYFEIDIFGSGPDELEIKRAFSGGDAGGGADDDGSSGILHSLNKKWSGSELNKKWSTSDLHRKLSSTDLHRKWSASRRQRLPANFKGRVDHSALAGDEYSIFVNPSLTEVLCTTTAEAIAMGKWAIVPSHPSNAFFVQFPNCLPYRNRREFVSTLRYALNNDPPHMSDELSSLLSWEAATARCVSAAAVSKREASRNDRLNKAKEEKTLKSTLSGLWSGSRGDLKETVSLVHLSSSPTLSEATGCVGAPF